MIEIWVATRRLISTGLCYDKHHWRPVENLVIILRFVESEGVFFGHVRQIESFLRIYLTYSDGEEMHWTYVGL